MSALSVSAQSVYLNSLLNLGRFDRVAPDISTGNEELGRSLRRRREHAALTLAQVAERAKITPQYLSDVERGRRLPSLDVLDRVAGALGCLAVELLVDVHPYGVRRRRNR